MRNTLLFIGDSLTEYFDWQQRFPNYSVKNLGRSGETVQELLERVPRVSHRIHDPKRIFIMSGINNVARGEFEIIEAYQSVLSELRVYFPKARLVVQGLLPILLQESVNAQVVNINAQLKELAERIQADYLDVFSSFVDRQGSPIPKLLLEDGVHLSSRGYEVWSAAVERYLKKVF